MRLILILILIVIVIVIVIYIYIYIYISIPDSIDCVWGFMKLVLNSQQQLNTARKHLYHFTIH